MTVLRNLVICTLAGVLLAALFQAPQGAVVGALHGLLVGVCVALADRRARPREPMTRAAAPIRLIGSHRDSTA